MKKILITVGAVLGGGAALLLAAPALVDWTAYKDEIAFQVSEATGRPLELAGPIRLSLLPVPRLEVQDVRLAGPPGAAEPVMARLKELEVSVALWPLLSGRIQVESVTLVEPVFVFEVLADGRFNWDFNGTRSPSSMRSSAGSGLAGAISFDQVTVEQGTIVYRDAALGQTETIADVNARVVASSLTGPLQAQGSFTVRGLPMKGDVNVGRLSEGTAASLRIGVSLAESDATVRFAGIITGAAMGGGEGAPGVRLQGEVRAEGDDLARTLAVLQPVIGSAPAGAPSQPFTLKAAVEAAPGTIRLSGLETVAGDSHATGSAAYRAGQPAQAEVSLTVNRLDIDGWQQRAAQPPAPALPSLSMAPGGRGGNGNGKGRPAAGAPALSFSWPAVPAGVETRVDLAVESVTWNGAPVQKLRAEATVKEDGAVLDRLNALLPGGTELAMAGTVTRSGDGPAAALRLTAGTGNLRGLLDWLKVDTAGVPAGRLGKASLDTHLAIRPGVVEAAGLDLTMDDSRATGGVTYAAAGPSRPRPALGVQLDIDRFNADAYHPPTVPAAETSAARGNGGGARGAASAASSRPLDGIDANLALAVGELTVGGVPVRGARLDATVSKGALTIREAQVADLAGLSGRMYGTLASVAPFQGADLTVTARAESLTGLSRLVTWPAAAPAPERLGPVTLDGRLTGDAAALGIEMALTAAGGSLEAGGVVRNPARPASPRIPDSALTLRVAHPDLSALAPLVADGAVALGGALDLYTEMTTAGGAVSLANIQGQVMDTAVAGRVDIALDGSRPRVDAALQTGDLDLDRLAGGTPAPAGKKAAPEQADGAAEALPFGWLRAADGRLALTASSIRAGGWRVDDTALKAALEDGVLTLDPMDGRFLGGRLGVSGTLSAPPGQSPTASLSLTLAGARPDGAGDARFPLSVADGSVDASFDLTTVGGSPQAMILGMAGTGSVAVRDGRLRGVDFAVLRDRLPQADRPQEVLEALVAATKGGETPFSILNATVTVDHGIARSEDIRLSSPLGQGMGEGSYDLLAGTVNGQVTMAPATNREVPPLILRLSGAAEAPSQSLDMNAVQAYLARRSAE